MTIAMKNFIVPIAMVSMWHVTISQIPAISSFTPTSGPIGTSVIINGTNFSSTASNNKVYFGAVKAFVQTAGPTSLTVTVPYGATFQPITVTVNNLVAYAARPFIVTATGGGMNFTSSSLSPPAILTGDAYVIGADLDGDGRTDLVYPGATTNKITIYRNTTTGSTVQFAPTDISGLTNPSSVKAGDMNGDGLLDLVVGCSSQFKLFVLQNTSTPGNISFASPISLNTTTEPRKIAIGDLDLDGKADIACSRASVPGISIFKNTSAGSSISFGARADITVTSTSEGIAIGDLTNDGKPEIITAASGASGITILENISTPGTISFNPRVHFFTDGSPWEVAIADIDGDGRADIMSSNTTSNNITVYRNAGTNPLAFDIKVNLPSATDPRGLEVGDLNVDGKPDIVSSHSLSDSTICVFKNVSTPGTIVFSAFVKYGSSPGLGSVALTDLDNDGLTDIAAGNLQNSKLSVFKNQVLTISIPCPGKPLLTQVNDTSFCDGGSVNLVASVNQNNQWYKNNAIISGATGISYSATTSGNYFLRVMNTGTGCYNYSDTVSITVFPAPAKPVITSSSTTLSATAGYTTYVWYRDNVIIAGVTTNQYNTTQNGVYKVTVSDINGCKNTSDNFTYAATAVNDVNFEGYTVELYPNPVINELTIQVKQSLSTNGKISMLVTDITGKRIQQQTLQPGSNTIYFNHLASGIYVIKLKQGNAEKTVKVLKLIR